MKIVKFLIFVISFFTIIYFISPSRKEALCNSYQNYLAIQFNGIVIKKFIDSNEHSFPYIYVKDFLNGTITKLNLFDDDQHTYENISLKDSIVKFKGSAWLYKRVNQKLVKVNIINFGCN
jgi:uncharacterized membrane protein YukC